MLGLGKSLIKDSFLFAANFEPETIAYMAAVSVSNDGTVYNSATPQQITGAGFWTAIDTFLKTIKTACGFSLGVSNASNILDFYHLFWGNSSALAKFNLINPLDTNAAHRLTFFGGITISSIGLTGNGSNAYANTYWTPSGNMASSNLLIGGYIRNVGTLGIAAGLWDLNNATRIYQFQQGTYTIGNTSSTSISGKGSISLRLDSTNLETVQDGAVKDTQAVPSLTKVNVNLYLLARNNNGASVNVYTDGELSSYYASGKRAFTQAEQIAINNADRALMAALGRL